MKWKCQDVESDEVEMAMFISHIFPPFHYGEFWLNRWMKIPQIFSWRVEFSNWKVLEVFAVISELWAISSIFRIFDARLCSLSSMFIWENRRKKFEFAINLLGQPDYVC